MGQEGQDGYFSTFKRDILKLKPEWNEKSIQLNSLRNERISFGWEGPLLVNEVEQPLSSFKHIDNPYCSVELPADQMDIRYDDLLLRLSFDR
jgi:hypothetical protein